MDWKDKLAAFRDLQKSEKSAYQKYTRSAQAAYQPIAETNLILESNSDYMALETVLMESKDKVASLSPDG